MAVEMLNVLPPVTPLPVIRIFIPADHPLVQQQSAGVFLLQGFQVSDHFFATLHQGHPLLYLICKWSHDVTTDTSEALFFREDQQAFEAMEILIG